MARLLVVDDDLLYLDELSEGLRSQGHDVTPATSAKEAIVTFENTTFDLAICDAIMAGGGALSFLYDVRARDGDFPIIIITGRKEIARSPLFQDGMREANAKLEKSASLHEINRVVLSLL